MVLMSPLFFFISYMLYISLAKYAAEREYVSTFFYLSVTIYALVLCPSSFAQITGVPNPLLFNNYLSRCKDSFEGSTIATLFTKARYRATCNFPSKQMNMKFICSFSSRSAFLCWSSKSVLFCLLYLAILL